jgi:large subunit ribosomal protein L21
MLAILEQGGKQHLVKSGNVLKVEKIDAEVGSRINMESVKFIITPDKQYIHGKGVVTAEVISQERDKKVIIFKRRRRKNSRRKNGHRQYLTILRIKDISI